MRASSDSEVRARLVDAAQRLFVERGFLQTSVEDLLVAAQISRASFYTYFENKLDLLTALADDHIDRRARHFDELSQIEPPDIDSVALWFRSAGTASADHRGIFGLMRLAVALDAKLMRRFATARDIYAEILGRTFRQLDLTNCSDDEREARRAKAHLLIVQVEQFAAGSADGSWCIEPETTSQAFARMIMQFT